MSFRKTLLITGASSGFGQALAREALDAGHRVVGTVRSEEARSALEAVAPGQAFGRLLDVTDLAAIEPTVAAIERDIGPLDVLVNSAGYGHEGILEESPLAEMRRQFEVNLFGAVAMIQAVLPYMRRRRRGHILNITSMGSYITMPGIPYYCGSKFALEGLSEALGKEVAGLGIAVTAVAPRLLPHRLGGPLDGPQPPHHRRLRRALRPGPPGAPGKERQATGRPAQGRARHAPGHRGGKPAGAPAAGQRCTGAGAAEAEGAGGGNRGVGRGHAVDGWMRFGKS